MAGKITFLVFILFTITSVISVPTTLDDVWIPNLRGLPIGREGEIVAEFEVSIP